MGVPMSRPMGRRSVSVTAGDLFRFSMPGFRPPVPSYMREPGTNYVSILTASGDVKATASRGLGPQIYLDGENPQVPTFRQRG